MNETLEHSTDPHEAPTPVVDEALARVSNSENAQTDHTGDDTRGDGVDDAGNDINFPKSLLKRIVKERLMNSEEATIRNSDSFDPSKVQISKNCLEAFDEAAKLFIHYLTWSAGEELRKTKRQTMGVEDVLNGLEEADYGEFVDSLRKYVAELQAGKKKNPVAL